MKTGDKNHRGILKVSNKFSDAQMLTPLSYDSVLAVLNVGSFLSVAWKPEMRPWPIIYNFNPFLMLFEGIFPPRMDLFMYRIFRQRPLLIHDGHIHSPSSRHVI